MLRPIRKFGAYFVLLCCLPVLIAVDAQSKPDHVVYGFHPDEDGNPHDLRLDKDGNIYGLTAANAEGECTVGSCGEIFRITPEGKKETVFSFAGGSLGWNPLSFVLADNGVIYGTTSSSSLNEGIIFKITPDGQETRLANFNLLLGIIPSGSMVIDKNGNVFGTAVQGGSCGCQTGAGSIYKIAPNGKVTRFHGFTPDTEGCHPEGGLTIGEDGTLYGATASCGPKNSGTLYKVTPKGTLTVLHSFKGSDGAYANSAPFLDSAGNLYGGTAFGGSPVCGQALGCGVIYKLTSDGTFKLLHTFKNWSDGSDPAGKVYVDETTGTLFGTTAWGGEGLYSAGTVFKITPNGKKTVLHTFHGPEGSGDGMFSYQGPLVDSVHYPG